jgi:hypothetical protein
MKSGYNCNVLYKMMTIFLSFTILLFVSPAQSNTFIIYIYIYHLAFKSKAQPRYIATGRFYQPDIAQSIDSTNTSDANTTVIIHSKTVEDNTCELVFCTKRSGCTNVDTGAKEDCYCCEPDPKMNLCFNTRAACKADCPFCRT